MIKKSVTFSPASTALSHVDSYRCEKVVGSLEFTPGLTYPENDVKRVLAKPTIWTVTFIKPKS